VIDGSDITIGPLASTLRACADESEAALEGHFTQALETARTFEIVGDRLSLFREDGGYAVILERA
jgi:heat shock protein HslJ